MVNLVATSTVQDWLTRGDLNTLIHVKPDFVQNYELLHYALARQLAAG